LAFQWLPNLKHFSKQHRVIDLSAIQYDIRQASEYSVISLWLKSSEPKSHKNIGGIDKTAIGKTEM